ncbi:MAG TPA: alpha/beta fold hydrolase [Rubrobacteraceae bacterium]|nr:alpha/beta fold hydrolase [Rubrobacteraceae bacterium]
MNDRTSIRFTEEMKGYIAFGESDYERGAQEGRKSDTYLMFHLTIEVDDLDRFAADPRREATAEGWVRCDDLGGKLPVEKGVFNLFVDEDDPALKRMLYRLFFRDGSGHPVTLAGFKVVRDDPGADVWPDTTTLYTRVLQGHIEAVDESTAGTIATGILHIGLLDFLKQLTTFRAEGPSPAARATALGRFGALFMGQLWQVYAQRAVRRARGRGGNSASASRMGVRPGRSAVRHRSENSRPSNTKETDMSLRNDHLVEEIVPFEAEDGMQCNLVHVQGSTPPDKGPVLLVHGAGVRANVFRSPVRTTLGDALVANGYDVWLENWRASIDLPPNPWTLDQAAVYDHPKAVKTVVEQTGSEEVKAVIHCQGSTSFMMSAVAGLVPEVKTIVANAVTLHPVVPSFSKFKITYLTPTVGRLFDYLNPQWGLHAPTTMAKILTLSVMMVHHECDNPVCKMVSFTYGSGFPALWSHENLNDETHEWLKEEFAHVPITFFRQMGRCVAEGHLVSVEGMSELPESFVAEPPQTDARFAFLAGERNQCFLPESQKKTFDFLDSHRRNYHSFHLLRNYGHLDVFMGKNAHQDVFPLILNELQR